MGKAWAFIKAANEAVGKPFFKTLVDAAHCGDSDLSIPENQALIQEIADAGALGVFHCSAKTTRGCFSTDDGWIGSLLAAAAASGSLEYVFVEYFHHEDEGLQALRDFDPIHGIDTTDGRTYDAMVVDGLVEIAHRLNNLHNRGILK